MRLTDDSNAYDSLIRSEGKVLEITPLIYGPSGDVLSLPPVSWEIPGWLIQCNDDYIMGYPWQANLPGYLVLPSSQTAAACRLSFMVRIMERQPESTVQAVTFDLEAVNRLVDYLDTQERLSLVDIEVLKDLISERRFGKEKE